MLRFIIIFAIIYLVYLSLKKSLQEGKQRGGSTRSRTEQKKDVFNTNRVKEISYLFYSATKDDSTCDICKELDGKHFLPNHEIHHSIKPPHRRCKNPNGCRCSLVYVTEDEAQSEKIELILKKYGGTCNKSIIEKELRG